MPITDEDIKAIKAIESIEKTIHKRMWDDIQMVLRLNTHLMFDKIDFEWDSRDSSCYLKVLFKPR